MSKYLTVDFSKLIDTDEKKENDNYWIVKCPECLEKLNYHKLKLYIAKDYSFGYCQRCKTTYYDKIIYFGHPVIRNSSTNLLGSYEVPPIEFSMMKMYYENSSFIDSKAIDYLISRNSDYLIDNYEKYGLRFNNSGIYFPYKFDGEYKYYTKRLYNPIGDIKYFLPPIKNKPFYFIDNSSDKYIIVEGPMDALAVDTFIKGYNIIAITGSTMSTYQINLFRSFLPEDAIIWLDKTELSMELMAKLKSSIPYLCTTIVQSNGDDPEELIINYINNGKDKSRLEETYIKSII